MTPRGVPFVAAATVVAGAWAFWRFHDLPWIAVIVTLSVPLTALVMGRCPKLVSRALTGASRDDASGKRAPVIGFIIVVATLALLEITERFYFAQDDNFASFPVTFAGARALLQGVFPTFNPYQMLGQPTSVQSILSLTNPFTYLAFAIAHAIGNDYAFADVFVIVHLLAAFGATYWATRTCGVRRSLASLSAVAATLAGATLMFSRSNAQMAPVMVWMPLLIGLTETLRRRETGARWTIVTGIVIALFCHAGHGQMWIYGICFFGLAIVLLLATREIAAKQLALSGIALLIGVALSLPLILPQMWFMSTVAREGEAGGGIEYATRAMLLPMPLVHAPHPYHWGNSAYTASLYYDGTLFAAVTLLALLAIFGIVFACRWRAADVQRLVASNVWLGCAFGALVIAFSEHGGVWDLMTAMPLFHMFTGPWKLLLYFNLFAAVAGAVILDRLLTPRGAVIAFVAVSALVVYNANMVRTAFSEYGAKPYPPLPAQMSRALTGPWRVLPLAPKRSGERDYVNSLALNFPSIYGIASFGGYDPFVEQTPEFLAARARLESDPLNAARAYGVRWVVIYRDYDDRLARFFANDPALRTVYRSDGVRVIEIAGASPLAFPAAEPLRPLPVTLSQRGVDVVTRGESRVVLNFLDRRGVVVEGARRVSRDSWGRVVVDVAPATDHIALRYDPGWRRAFIAAAVVLLIALALLAFARDKPSPVLQATSHATGRLRRRA